MASEAEARMRKKAEAQLRREFPDYRVVHEFDVCGRRLDLAAIGTERLVLVEIKSERDDFERLQGQLQAARKVASEIWLCIPPAHVSKVEHLGKSQLIDDAHEIKTKFGCTWALNPEYIPELSDADVWLETADGFASDRQRRQQYFGAHPIDPILDSVQLLRLLLKPELLELHPGPKRRTSEQIVRTAHDALTGKQIRLGVLDLLRRRRFLRIGNVDPECA
ncbi:MAG TPA: hypothetical protein VIM56_03840 [Rhizomicrobium sp.]